jgi:hypothetical protein
MSKIDFLNNFNNVCEELGIQLDSRIEYGIVLSQNNINTDKINISIKKEDITEDNFIHLVKKLFDYPDKVISFINNISKSHDESIQYIFFGYSNGTKELYFEVYSPGESSYILSYDEHEDKINEYQIDDTDNVINEIIDLVKTETGLILQDYVLKGGWKKNNSDAYHLLVIESLSSMSIILKELCKKIYPNNYIKFEEWLNIHNEDYQISNLGYNKIDNEIILNIYITKINN